MVRYKMGSLPLMSQTCTALAMVVNAYAISWFDSQNTCRLLGQEMPSVSHREKPYWTKYYKSQSDWIGKYGCYHRTDLTGAKTFNLHLPSAGLCQEFCMEYNESKKLLFFGVQKGKCICLSEHPAKPSLMLNECNFDCLINKFLNRSMECGGSGVYSVFVSEKGMPDMICNHSTENCYHEEEQVKILLMDETTCNLVYENYRDKCFIELTTQIYTSFDRGKKLSKPDQRNILSCQQCTEQGCIFANCTSHLNITYCTKNVLSTAHPSVLKTITQTVVTNVTEKRVSSMWITYNKLVSRYKNQTLIHRANVPRTTQPTSKEDTITKDLMKFIVGGIALSAVLCFLFLVVAIYVLRRKHTSIEDKFSTLQKQIECSRLRYGQTSIAKLNPQNKPEHQNLTGASYYELADNSKINEKCYNTKENKEPCCDIRQTVLENNVFMLASYKTLDGDSVNFDRKEGSYDHHRETSRFRHEENAYDHAGNVNESDYSCAEAARNWNDRRIDNDLYDYI